MRERGPLFLIHTAIFVIFFGALSFGQENLAREETELFKKYQSLNKNYEKGKMHFAREDYKKAKKEFEKILGKLPEHADAHFFLSQVLYREGSLEEALSHMEKAKTNYEFSAKMKLKMAQVGKAKLEEQKQKHEDKLRELEDRLISQSKSADESDDMSASLQSAIDNTKKKIKNVETQLNMPISSEEEIPADYCYINGNIYFKMKKFQEAHDQYQEAITIDPSHGDSYNNLAALYFQVKQYQKALNYLNQAEENGAEVNPEFKKAVLKALEK
jgi:tetratricopeptide (TPR) repeat protein